MLNLTRFHFLGACEFIAYDLAARGRFHRATISGGLLLVASHPLWLVVGNTQARRSFAGWPASRV